MKKKILPVVVLALILGCVGALVAVNHVRTRPWLAYAQVQAAEITDAVLVTEYGESRRPLTDPEVEELAQALRAMTPEHCEANPEHAGTTPDRWLSFTVKGEKQVCSWCGGRQRMALRWWTEEDWLIRSDRLDALLSADGDASA